MKVSFILFSQPQHLKEVCLSIVFSVLLIFKDYAIPSGSVVKDLSANAADACSIPGLGRSPGGEKAAHSSIRAQKTPWTEQPGGFLYSPWGHRVRTQFSD